MNDSETLASMEAPNISMCEFRRLWNICAKSRILLQRLIALVKGVSIHFLKQRLDLFLSKLGPENGGVSVATRFRLDTDNQDAIKSTLFEEFRITSRWKRKWELGWVHSGSWCTSVKIIIRERKGGVHDILEVQKNHIPVGSRDAVGVGGKIINPRICL